MAEQLDRYRIVEKIGQGGFAFVYRAQDTKLDRPVALKELRPALLQNDEWVERFKQEARTIARLDHPRIVTIHDVLDIAGRLFIVMRLVDGPGLDELIATNGALPWLRALNILSAIAEGLDYAHAHHILHRDLKPANILLDSKRGPLLTDFGLAKLVSEASLSATGAGSIMGTPHYIPPEVWEGQGASHQSDIYALGCILYELLTGQKLFGGNTPPAVMMAHFGPLTLPDTWPDSIPPGLDNILRTALAKTPTDRYPTAGTMVQALAELAASSQRKFDHSLMMPEPNLLHIRLLGEFRLTYGDAPLAFVHSPRLQSLLAYLLLHRDTPQPRQHLAFLFWPDTTESQAMTNLRNLLHRLRQALPNTDQFLRIEAQVLQWQPNAPYTLDVADFELAANAASVSAWQEAATRYTGPLLPGCYDEWILPERERLHQTLVETLEKLAHHFEQQHDYPTAIRYTQHLLHHEPVQETAHRQLMRLYALKGDRASALRAYHTCVTMLQQELAVEPSQATRTLYEQLLNPETVPSTIPAAAPTATPHLVGRQSEWQQLQAIWHSSAKGHAHLVAIAGDVGIGKTKLAEAYLQWARRQGITTALASCHAAGGALAYAPIATWLKTPGLRARLSNLDDLWLSEVARLLPEILVEQPALPQPGALTESWQRQRLFEALARAMLNQTERQQPLFLHLDDIHWCDQETLEWLHYLLRFDPNAPLLIVVTLRQEEVGEDHPLTTLLLALRQSQQLTEIELAPLDAAQTVELAATIAPQPLNPALTARLFTDTEGNPLFIVETLRAGLVENAAEQLPATSSDASAQHQSVVLEPRLPHRVQAVLEARLAQLSPQARELATLAAVIGRAFTIDILAQASNDDEDTLVHGLDELWQRRLVREHGLDAYDFSHDKLRQVAYARLSLARRRLLHRRVAQALETVHASNLTAVHGQIASHYERAGQPGQALIHYQQAAEAARQIYANDEAIRFYRQALTQYDAVQLTHAQQNEEPNVFLQLSQGLGDVLALTGHYDQARETLEATLEHAPSLTAIEQACLYRLIGNTWRSQRQYDQALQSYQLGEDVLEQLPETTAEQKQEWIQLQLERMWGYYWVNQWYNVAELAEKIRPILAQSGTPSQRISFALSLTSIHLQRDRYVASNETISLCREALDISRQAAPDKVAWAQFVLGFNLLWFGELEEAKTALQQALQIAERTGDIVHQARCLTYLTITHRKLGQVKPVREVAERALIPAKTAQMDEYIGMVSANLAWVSWREGNLAEAESNGQTAITVWQTLPGGHASYFFQWTARFPLMAIALTQNKLNSALEHAQVLLAPSQQQLPNALTAALEAANHASDEKNLDAATLHLKQAVEIAQNKGYL